MDLPRSQWARAGLLRFCLTDVLPYQQLEVDMESERAGNTSADGSHRPRQARQTSTARAAWPSLDGDANSRPLALAVKDIQDTLLMPLANGGSGPVGRYDNSVIVRHRV